jgi:hypothetical protein
LRWSSAQEVRKIEVVAGVSIVFIEDTRNYERFFLLVFAAFFLAWGC